MHLLETEEVPPVAMAARQPEDKSAVASPWLRTTESKLEQYNTGLQLRCCQIEKSYGGMP